MTINLVTNQVFDKKPNNFFPRIEVSSCFIEYKDKVLFLLRSPHVSQPNVWAIPAGVVEKGETHEEAVIREILEETSLDLVQLSKTALTPLEFSQTVFIRQPDFDYAYHMYRITLDHMPNNIILDDYESSDYKWLIRRETNQLNVQNMLIMDEMPCIERIYGENDFSSPIKKSIASQGKSLHPPEFSQSLSNDAGNLPSNRKEKSQN